MFEHRRIIKDIFRLYGIDISFMVMMKMLHIDDAKKWLVREEYHRLYREEGYSYRQVKEILRDRYGLSVSSIEKLVYRQ